MNAALAFEEAVGIRALELEHDSFDPRFLTLAHVENLNGVAAALAQRVYMRINISAQS